MKKILFASTALIATAGVAAAEIDFSANARFGLSYAEDATIENDAGDDVLLENETRIEQRMRFQVKGTTETDGGVEFSARFRAEAGESADNSINGGGFGGAEFGISFGGLNVFVGNTANVMESGDQIDLYGYGIGLSYILETDNAMDAPTESFSSSGDDKTVIKADYTVGDFMASFSYAKNQKFDGEANTQADVSEMQLGLGYSFASGIKLGIAYSDTDTAGVSTDYTMIGMSGAVGAVSYNVVMGDGDNITDTAIGMSAAYDVNSATTLMAVYTSGGNTVDDSFGLGFEYDLGGNVALRGGVASVQDKNKADFGVTFSF